MKKIILLSLCSLGLTAAEPVKVAPEHILFLSHYDQSTEPAAGNVENAQCPARLTTGAQGFPFKNVGFQEALDANGWGKYHILPAKGNFDPGKGTIQMWILPKWSMTGEAHNVFFQFAPTPEKRSQFNWQYFHLQKRPKKMVFSCWGSDKEIPIESIRSDGWIQLAVTWDRTEKQGRRCFYVNGEMADEVKLNGNDYKIEMPGEIMIGAPCGWNAKSLIDEVRILNYPLTAAEIKQDFEANMDGKPFTSPAAQTEGKVSFKPVEVKAGSETNSALIDASEVFSATAIRSDFKLDGDLNKPIWTKATVVTGLLPVRKTSSTAKNRTELRLLYSPKALYVGVVCWQDMSKMTAQFDQDEMPTWDDDNVECFFDIPGKNRGFYQFCINPLGSTTDLRDGKMDYNAPGRETQAKRYQDRWEMEMKIPFAAFNMMPPFPGDFIGFRLCRSVKYPFDSSSIPQLHQTGNNRRVDIGKLVFGPESGVDQMIALSADKTTFLPGLNRCLFTIKNQGKEDFKGELVVQAQNRTGQLSRMKSEPIEIKAGETVTREVRIPVNNTRVAKLAVSVENASGEASQYLLKSGFAYAEPGPDVMFREMTANRNSLAFLNVAEHPVYRNAVASLDKILARLDKFNSALDEAIKNGTVVSGEECNDIAAQMAGFRKYMEENRYLVWQTSPWEVGSPDALPPRRWNAEEPLELEFRQASNEREAICLIFSGLFSGPRLRLRVVPQSVWQDKTFVLSCDHFEVYTEEFLHDAGDIISVPLIQAPGNFITLTPGKPVRVWIMFNSRGVKPGKYQTKILLKPAYDQSVPVKEIPVTVKVWNFTLPETHEWPLQSFMWGPNHTEYDECESLRLVHSCHMTHGFTQGFNYICGIKEYQRAEWPLPKGMDFRENLVRNANQKFFELAKELKMKFVFGWNLPVNDIRWYELMSDRLDKMGFKPGDYIFKALIKDEFVKKHIPIYAAVRQKIADLKKDWWFQAVYLSTPPPTGATMDDIEEAKLPEFYKIWMVIRRMLNDPIRGEEVIRRLRAKGCQVWSYSCSLHMAKKPLLDYYRLYIWECYLKGLDGVAWWIFIGPRGDDGFNEDDGVDEGVALRGIDKKPVPTKMLQAIREGLEDVAYMDRLGKELQRVKANGKSFPEYEKLLADREGILERSNQAEVDDWRLKAGQAIDRLTQE